MLYGLLALWAWTGRGRREDKAVRVPWISQAAAFLLFSGSLKWQPWHTRLQLPFFVLAAIPAALPAGSLRRPRLAAAIVPLLAVGAFQAALLNEIRPLQGADSVLQRSRSQTLFNDRREEAEGYLKAAAIIAASGCRQIGLSSSWGFNYFYPVFQLLKVAEGKHKVRFTYQDEKPGSPPAGFEPCAVWCLNCDEGATRIDFYR